MFFTDERWQAESKKHYARLSLPSKAATFLKPLLARVTAGVDAVAAAARSGVPVSYTHLDVYKRQREQVESALQLAKQVPPDCHCQPMHPHF